MKTALKCLQISLLCTTNFHRLCNITALTFTKLKQNTSVQHQNWSHKNKHYSWTTNTSRCINSFQTVNAEFRENVDSPNTVFNL